MSDFNRTSAFGRRAPAGAPQAGPASRPTRSSSRGGVPSWPLFALLLIAVVVIQRFPIPGVVLMIMAAPLWPIVLVNLLLLSIAGDALRGAAPRWMLAIPVLVYSLNLIASGVSFAAYLTLRHEIISENAQASVAYDPARMTLVGPNAEALVERYAIPVAYDPSRRYADYNGALAMRVLPEAVCDSLPKFHQTKPPARQYIRIGDASVSNACLLQSPEEPTLPAVKVETSTEEIKGLVEGRIIRTTVTPPGGPSRTLRQARVGILPPIPLVVSGCALNSGALKWQCFNGMMRWPVRIQADKDYQDGFVLARALGLKPRIVRPLSKVNYRPQVAFDEAETLALSQSAAGAVQQARAITDAEVEVQLALLDRVLAGATDVQSLDHDLLMSRTDKVASRAGRIMRWLEAGGSGENRRFRGQFMEIAASLPPDAFAPIGGRLFQQVLASEEPVRSELITVRMGDAGPAAWPWLQQRATDGRTSGLAALAGLCRAGHPSLAPAVAASEPARRGGNPLVRKELKVVALARMGRPDLARPIIEDLPPTRRAWAQARLAEITPASPPTVCRPERPLVGLPRMPWLTG